MRCMTKHQTPDKRKTNLCVSPSLLLLLSQRRSSRRCSPSELRRNSLSFFLLGFQNIFVFFVSSGGMDVSIAEAAKRIIAAGRTSGMVWEIICSISVGGFIVGAAPIPDIIPIDWLADISIDAMVEDMDTPPILLLWLLSSHNIRLRCCWIYEW